MEATQLNTRIDSDLKRAGDQVFSAIGFTTSEVVRFLWRFAARNRKNPEKVKQALLALDCEKKSNDVQVQEKLDRIRRGPFLMSDFFASQGLVPDAALASFDARDELDAALAQRFGLEVSDA